MGIGDSKEKEGRAKKVRRGGKRIKNKLKKFKVLYVNLRGYKSKKKSINEIILEEKPTLIAFTETLLAENEEIEIEGYIVPAEKGSRQQR